MVFRLFALLAILFCGSAQAAEITSFPIKGRDGAILIKGDMTFEDKDVFLTKIAPFDGGVVILSSNGGSAYAGIEIGKAIRMRGFKTWVESGTICTSACAIAWLGGVERLMGKAAVIGFHAVYSTQSGAPVETGSGNAMYGAYLGQLGLSNKAIVYLTDAAPTSMNWLTPADAENIGLNITIFDPKSTPVAAAPPPKAPAASSNGPPANIAFNLEGRARDFIIALNNIMSGPDDQYLKFLDGVYSDPVVYLGKQLPRTEVISQLSKFIDRWPIRAYVVRPETLKVQCNNETSACEINGLLEFSAKSVARNQWSRGTATFEYLLSFRPNARWPIIVNEGGSVVDRKITELQSIAPSYPQTFDPSR